MKYDVIVIGLGPVGITLANLLSSHGLRVLAIDAATDIYDKPRAIGIDHEAMRVFQQIGVADAVADAVDIYRPSEYRTAEGEVVRRFESQSPPYELSWAPYLTFLQPNLERALRARGAERDNLELRYGTSAVALHSIETNPSVTFFDAATRKEVVEAARFVVGCDGGNSFVRKSLGIAFEDLIFDEPWLVVDTLLKEGAPPDLLPAVNVQYCDPKRPHTFVSCARDLRRWEFMILPGEDLAEAARPENVWRLLRPYITPEHATLWRAATYRFHALVAREWRKGRVFLAGDACHMTPPFLAQGMVQGIKDVANLSWKIASVCRGAAPALLDTYQTERQPHVRDVIKTTKELGRIIGERDPERAAVRDLRMREAMVAGQGVTVRQNLFPALRNGVFLETGSAGSCVGVPAPQPWVRSGERLVRLDDLTGPRFLILATPSFELDRQLADHVNSLKLPVYRIGNGESSAPEVLEEQDGVFAGWMQSRGLQAIVVRPDHLVFAGVKDGLGLSQALELYERWMGDESACLDRRDVSGMQS